MQYFIFVTERINFFEKETLIPEDTEDTRRTRINIRRSKRSILDNAEAI